MEVRTNKFIVFEGIDGSGKGTQVQLFVDYLIGRGEKVWLTKEPTADTEIGKKIRAILKGELPIPADPMELQRMYVEDRRQHIVEIEKHLANGEWVVSDRYLWSTVAYGSASGGDYDTLLAMNRQFLVPDITFLIDISAETAMERIGKRGEAQEYFEHEDQLSKIRQVYLKLAETYPNAKIINGNRSIEEVLKEIKGLV